jgi:hypothetical protein
MPLIPGRAMNMPVKIKRIFSPKLMRIIRNIMPVSPGSCVRILDDVAYFADESIYLLQGPV